MIRSFARHSMPSHKRRRTAEQASAPPIRTSARVASRSAAARGKSSIVVNRGSNTLKASQSTTTQTESSIVATPTDDRSHGGSYALKDAELTQEASKIVNNPSAAELMILELVDKYSISLPRLKELLGGKPVTPFSVTLLRLTTD